MGRSSTCNHISVRQLDEAALKKMRAQEGKVRGSFRFLYTCVAYNMIRPSVMYTFPNVRGEALFERNTLVEALARSRTVLGELMKDNIPVPWEESDKYDVRLLETTLRKYVPVEKIFASFDAAGAWIRKKKAEEQARLDECIAENTINDEDDLPLPLRTFKIDTFGFYVPLELVKEPGLGYETESQELSPEEEEEMMMRERAQLYQPGPPDPLLKHLNAAKGIPVFEVAYKRKDRCGWKSFSTAKEIDK